MERSEHQFDGRTSWRGDRQADEAISQRLQRDCFGLRPRNDGNAGAILVVAAVPQELRGFRLNGDRRVECLITGMGQRAREAVRRRLMEGDIRLVVSAGFAGGACPGFQVGDLVLASEVREQATGRVLRPAPLPERMREVARVGPLITVPALLDPAGKTRAGGQAPPQNVGGQAIAVEMETLHIASAAEEAGVRWLALRVILDPMEVPVAVGSMGQALGWAAQPWRWTELARFLGSVRTAGESLARGLELLVEQVAKAELHKERKDHGS